MDSAQAAPPSGSSPIADNTVWNWTMIQATTHMMGLSRPSNHDMGQSSSFGDQCVDETTR